MMWNHWVWGPSQLRLPCKQKVWSQDLTPILRMKILTALHYESCWKKKDLFVKKQKMASKDCTNLDSSNLIWSLPIFMCLTSMEGAWSKKCQNTISENRFLSFACLVILTHFPCRQKNRSPFWRSPLNSNSPSRFFMNFLLLKGEPVNPYHHLWRFDLPLGVVRPNFSLTLFGLEQKTDPTRYPSNHWISLKFDIDFAGNKKEILCHA